MKVQLLVPWVGDVPKWTQHFLHRVQASAPLVQVKIIHDTWTNFRARIERTTRFHPAPSAPKKKLCDFRPAYGEIFADEIGDADWWGWCDLDCVFGDLPAFLTEERLNSCDLITDAAHMVNGPFTIIRNREEMNRLYRIWPGVRVAFEAEAMTGHEYWFTGVVMTRRKVFSTEIPLVSWGPNAPNLSYTRGIRPLFLANAHTHDNESSGPPELRDRKLFSAEGREIMTYHFVKKRGWPL
jgi:hypothetical protein